MSTQAVSLKITLRYKDVDEFAKRYAENISSAGLFLRTRTPKPAGSKIRFELMLSDGNYVLRGDGVVVNIRQDDKPGMAIRFNVLDGESWATVERVVATHGNGSLAPTPLGAPFRSASSGSASEGSRRTRTSLRAGGVGKGTGPIRSPFIQKASPAKKAWSKPPAAKAAPEEVPNESEGDARPSMLVRPWATGRNANIDTSELRTARFAERAEEDLAESEAADDAEALAPEKKNISPAEFLSRASSLVNKASSQVEFARSPLDTEKARENVMSLESDELVANVQVRQTSDAGIEALEPPPPIEAEIDEPGEEEQTSEEPELAEDPLTSSELLSDEAPLEPDEKSAPETSDLAELPQHEMAADVEIDPENIPAEMSLTSAETEDSQFTAEDDDADEDLNFPEPEDPSAALAADDEDLEDDWASAFDDYADSSLPTKVVTPSDPTDSSANETAETALISEAEERKASEDTSATTDSGSESLVDEFVLGGALPSFEDLEDEDSEEELVSVPSEELEGSASADAHAFEGLGDPTAPPLSEALGGEDSEDLSHMQIIEREAPASNDIDEVSDDSLDEASESELFGVVDSLFETDEDEQPLPKLRASVSPDVLHSPPMVDAVLAAAEAEERENTGEFVTSSPLEQNEESIEEEDISDSQGGALEALMQTRPVRGDSVVADEDLPPDDFALYSNATAVSQDSLSPEQLEDSADDILKAFVEEDDNSDDINPNRLSVDNAFAFAEEGNAETVIDGSADEYLGTLSAPNKVESIAPATNLVSEIVPNRPISAETVADTGQEHWTPSEIERGYAVDISSHVGTAKPMVTASVAIDLGGQWIRVGILQDGVVSPISIDGLTHYPGLLGLYDNYEVAQGSELLSNTTRRPAEVTSIMQLLRGVQGEPFSSRENAEKVRVEADGRCTTDLLGRKWNLVDLLNAFWAPIGFAINQHTEEARTDVLLIVPSGTSDFVKSLLSQSCEQAEIRVNGFVEDNTAILKGCADALAGHETALLIDFGETHLNVCFVTNEGSEWQLKSSKWDANVSCRHIDERIARLVVSEIGDEWSSLSGEQRAVLYKSVSSIRGDSSKDPSVAFTIPAVEQLEGQTVTLERTRIYQETQEYIDRAIVMARGMLNDFSIHPKSVGAVVLVGGAASYQPLISGMTTVTGKIPVNSVDADKTLVAGALGVSLGHSGPEAQSSRDVLNSSIGIALPGGRFKVLLEAGTPLPARVARRNPTTKDNQSEFELELYQGDSATVAECSALGRISLGGLPKGARGQVFVDLEIGLQTNGEMRVQLFENHTGSKQVATFWTEQTPIEDRKRIDEENRLIVETDEKAKGKKGLFGRLFGR